MKQIKQLVIFFLVGVLGLSLVWAADGCTPSDISHNFVNTVAYNNTGNTGTDKNVYYYFTVPGAGVVTFNNPTGDVTFDYDLSSCPTTSSTALVNGNTITFASAGDFNMLVHSTSANKDFSFTMTFAFSGNQSPVAINDVAESDGVNPTIIDVLINDYDLDGTLVKSSVAISTAPSHGTLSINPASGEVTYTPTAFIGNDSFTYTVQDNNGAISIPATVTITYPVPIAYDKIYSVVPSGTLNGNVITDSPVDPNYVDHNHTATYKNTSGITLGTLTFAIPNDGDFSYAAPASTTSQSFKYKVTNKYGMVSNEATVYIYVNEYCANAITLLSADTNCSTNDTNSTSNNVTASGGQYYKIILAEDGVLDINLTNTDPQTGGTILYYDFGEPCGAVFTKGTTSQLDAGYRSKVASMVLSAGTYYLGLQGKSNTNPTDYSVAVTFRSACAGGPPIYPFVLSSVGINEPGIDYDVDKNITTKVVNKQFGLHASYLNASGNVDTYDGSYGSGKTVDMTVIVAHADGGTCTDSKVIGQGIIYDNDEDTVITPLVIDSAYKDRRIKVTAFDFGQLFTDASGLNCGTSSLNSSLCLVPACFNNVQNIRSVFPPAFQPGVMTCIYGDGSGLAAPCDSNAYYGNCGGRRLTISPLKYNVDLGCAMCLADAMQGNVCSADNFAIRPNDFNSTITPNQTFIAGQSTALTFYANKYAGIGAPYYNEVENSSFEVDINISDSTKTCAQPSIDFTPSINFTNGVAANGYALNNVGDFNLTMHEITGSEYALVDADDSNDTIRLITPHTKQIKVIPHHFGIDGNLTNGSNDRTFTYLSNFQVNDTNQSRNVSASLDLNVSAQAENNATTSNYTSLCYAKDGNVTLTLTNPITFTPAGALSKLLWYHYTPDSNGSIPLDATTTQYKLPFLKTAFDSNVTNGMAQFNYKINFDRNATKVVNPFMVVVDQIGANDTDSVTGLNTNNSNATFLFSRSHASKQRYNGPTGTANIYYESYCFGAGCYKDLLPSYPALDRTDDIRWFINYNHVSANDGVVGTVAQKGGASIVTATAPNYALTYKPTTNLTYNATKGYPYKTTMENNASIWLIQNEADPNATKNEFQVEFDLSGGWTGEHETNTTTKDVGSVNTNRRTMW